MQHALSRAYLTASPSPVSRDSGKVPVNPLHDTSHPLWWSTDAAYMSAWWRVCDLLTLSFMLLSILTSSAYRFYQALFISHCFLAHNVSTSMAQFHPAMLRRSKCPRRPVAIVASSPTPVRQVGTSSRPLNAVERVAFNFWPFPSVPDRRVRRKVIY